jgi:glycerol-3-phosphate acyltransferase PlsY
MTTFLFILIAYLIGSLSFAIIVSRAMGLPDPHSYGSGNPGATNVLRSGRKLAAILTLVGDALKGWVAVVLAQVYGPRFGVGDAGVAAVALAAFVGHLYPVFFGFRGGKGVATAAGILFALNVWLGLATFATFAIIAFFFRYVSLASMLAAAFAAFYAVLLYGFDAMTLAVIAMAVLLVYRHRGNIRKLANGTENRIGQKKRDPA